MIGKTHSIKTTVDKTMLASTVGSGLLDVYATPMMLALMEQAASELLTSLLGPEETSVGTKLCVEHTSATPCGMEVTATATITAAEGRQVEFALSACDEAGEIGRGTHSRFVVNRDKFMKKANAKKEAHA